MNINRVFKNIIFSSIIVATFFLALEAGSRLAYYLYTKKTDYLTYGFDNIFSKHALAVKEEDDKRPVFRIACFGGSTTLGGYISKANTYPNYLQIYLQERFPDKRIVVENFGIGGATAPQASPYGKITPKDAGRQHGEERGSRAGRAPESV